jgi:hypothetical protein
MSQGAPNPERTGNQFSHRTMAACQADTPSGIFENAAVAGRRRRTDRGRLGCPALLESCRIVGCPAS